MGTHVLNLYAITNTNSLRARYRLVDIQGSFGDEDLADQNLSLLAKRVALHLFGAKFEGVPLRFDQRPLAYEPKFFSVPSLRFGQGKVLDASAVGLERLGNARMGYLLDPQGGLAVHGPLGAQCIFCRTRWIARSPSRFRRVWRTRCGSFYTLLTRRT